MAKIKIPFNNKTYSVDESSFSDAAATLKSHLSTVMNGTGATINFGGANYNVDAVKLAATTNAFISHLGTVSGNGYKVKIGGIEYGVDANKMTNAIAQIEAVLGGLHNPDGIESPEKNEYGFYYNVPYTGHIVEDYGDGHIEERNEARIFYEDGKILYLSENETKFGKSNYFSYDGISYTYNSSSNTATDELGFDYIFSSDGLSFTVNSHGYWESIDGVNFTATGNLAHSPYFNACYMSYDGSQLIFSDDGSAMYITSNGTQITFNNLNWDTTTYYAIYEDGDDWCEWFVSIDGENILMYEPSMEDDKWFTRTANPSDVYIPGLYQTGALERYNTDGAAAISNMRITSMVELIESGAISIEDGVLNHEPMSKTRVAVPSCALEGDLLLPQDGSVTSIAHGAFSHCYGLTGILLPSGLTSIGEHAFAYASMESITIPNTVTYIGPWALDTEYLQHIVFDGTMQEWEMVTKELGWNELAPATYVQCSDGQVSLV